MCLNNFVQDCSTSFEELLGIQAKSAFITQMPQYIASTKHLRLYFNLN